MVRFVEDATGPRSASQPVDLGRKRRADAERNRAALLDAARALVADRGFADVTMDEVASAAGVGKGTLFRAFGDKSGLAIALLDDHERDLQEGALRGPAPLGPGAPAADRLDAFVAAYLAFLDDAGDLLAVADNSPVGARYRTGAYAFWHAHVRVLLTEAGADDPALEAHCVLAPLAADLYLHVRRDEAVPAERWTAAVRRWASRPPDTPR